MSLPPPDPSRAASYLVGLGEVTRGQDGVFGRLQAVGGALGHDDVHGHVAHRVQFLTHRKADTHTFRYSPNSKLRQKTTRLD